MLHHCHSALALGIEEAADSPVDRPALERHPTASHPRPHSRGCAVRGARRTMLPANQTIVLFGGAPGNSQCQRPRSRPGRMRKRSACLTGLPLRRTARSVLPAVSRCLLRIDPTRQQGLPLGAQVPRLVLERAGSPCSQTGAGLAPWTSSSVAPRASRAQDREMGAEAYEG